MICDGLASHRESNPFSCFIPWEPEFASVIWTNFIRLLYKSHSLPCFFTAHTTSSLALSHASTLARTHPRTLVYSLAYSLIPRSRYFCQFTYQNLVVDLLHLFTLITQIIQFFFVFIDKRLYCWQIVKGQRGKKIENKNLKRWEIKYENTGWKGQHVGLRCLVQAYVVSLCCFHGQDILLS